jgi:hypothetical protein
MYYYLTLFWAIFNQACMFPYALSGRDFIAGLYHRALPCAVASAPSGPFAYWFRLLNGFLTLCWAFGLIAVIVSQRVAMCYY